jgi:hypothetical protein
MKLYKLTDEDGYTQRGSKGETLWRAGQKLTLKPCINPQLCTSQVIHAYTNANLALLLNPCHANLNNPLLWAAKGTPKVRDWGKVGCFSLTATQQLELPSWYIEEAAHKRVVIQFAILCAESVLVIFEKQHPNDDRPRKAIEAAKGYLKHPTVAARAAYAAAYAARAAAYAAADAADAARAAAYAADAAYAAAYAARADAAYAAADAARAAAYAAADAGINFAALADKAVASIMKTRGEEETCEHTEEAKRPRQ